MKKLLLLLALLPLAVPVFSQKKIRDKHITHQQERMVFKQWDEDLFTPTPGFLWLNPEYWITWALHPNYPDTDLRPLGPIGPQTQRLALVAAMQSTDNAYKLQADTIRGLATTELLNYAGAVSSVDPLWILFYSREFEPLISNEDSQVLAGLSPREKDYLVSSGAYGWFVEESHALLERLQAARNTTMDRGSRILAYHRMLEEYRKLKATWEDKKQRAKLYLSLRDKNQAVKKNNVPLKQSSGKKTDKQIAEDILKASKL
ncbi:hypothetical protein CA265_20735 [Sphingobacteriaceae bacterium GW460-11-11-14-LB5]|nr:hypothetical protein CA265_20735 [Sphingobacteriaceae bacterium GW460-11-11-14-LB5]